MRDVRKRKVRNVDSYFQMFWGDKRVSFYFEETNGPNVIKQGLIKIYYYGLILKVIKDHKSYNNILPIFPLGVYILL